LYGRCRDAGVIHFDCANIYSGGRAEEILGRLVAPERDSIVLATKAYFPMGDGPNDRGASRYHLIRAVEASLRRLKTDRIDILYLHRFDEETTLEESLRALDALILAGKVVYPGVSNFAAWQVIKANGLAEMKGWSRLACVQSMYSLLKRQAEVEILPMALAEGLGVFAYSPLAAGMLTGRYGVDKDPEHGRIVDNPRYQVRYGDPSFRQAADAFLSLAADRGVHPVSLAIRWVLEHPAVTAAVLGARSVDQLEPQLESLLVPWDDSLRAAVSALTPEPPPPTDRNEEREGH
jgi:aryl-alcohol dehydrogenase-like predicted oxidoreductase